MGPVQILCPQQGRGREGDHVLETPLGGISPEPRFGSKVARVSQVLSPTSR